MNEINTKYHVEPNDKGLAELLISHLENFSQYIDHIDVNACSITIVLMGTHDEIEVNLEPPQKDVNVLCWKSYLIGTVVARINDIVCPGYHNVTAKAFTETIAQEYAVGTRFYDVADFNVSGVQYCALIAVHPDTKNRAYVIVTVISQDGYSRVWGITPWMSQDILSNIKMLPPVDLVPILDE